MKVLIKNGYIVDPSQGIDGVGEILIEEGKIKEVREHRSGGKRDKAEGLLLEEELKVIDATGLYLSLIHI